MSVTYDDSVGVEVSSDSFWEVMPPLPAPDTEIRLIPARAGGGFFWWGWMRGEVNISPQQHASGLRAGRRQPWLSHR